MTALLLTSLERYREIWTTGFFHYDSFARREEQATTARFMDFVAKHERCLEREYELGHVTGSAFILNESMDRVLLTLHRKLGKWLQLGGHCDGEALVHDAALREGQEESGLLSLRFLPYEDLIPTVALRPLPFDVDVHLIPARKSEPEHWHFDVRYLLLADPEEPLVISEESKDLRWVTLADAQKLAQERSMLRPFAKIALLREKFMSPNRPRRRVDWQVGDPIGFERQCVES